MAGDLKMFMCATPPLYAYSAFMDTHSTSERYDPEETYCNNSFGKNENIDAKTCDGHQDPQSNCSPRKETGLEQDGNPKSPSLDYRRGSDNSNLNMPCKENLRYKKRVSFADDKGLSLVEIRSIPNNPGFAKWAREILAMLAKRFHKVPSEKKWIIAFPNTSCNPQELNPRLEKDQIALESVTVEESEKEDLLKGTIVVRNTAYEQKVFLRISFDRWLSYEDIPAIYNPKVTSSAILENSATSHDYFSFSAVIPPTALRHEVMEFCVCNRAYGKEHWDDNGGINYRIISATFAKAYKITRENPQVLSSRHQRAVNVSSPIKQGFSACTEIDTNGWKAFMNEQPYW